MKRFPSAYKKKGVWTLGQQIYRFQMFAALGFARRFQRAVVKRCQGAGWAERREKTQSRTRRKKSSRSHREDSIFAKCPKERAGGPSLWPDNLRRNAYEVEIFIFKLNRNHHFLTIKAWQDLYGECLCQQNKDPATLLTGSENTCSLRESSMQKTFPAKML